MAQLRSCTESKNITEFAVLAELCPIVIISIEIVSAILQRAWCVGTSPCVSADFTKGNKFYNCLILWVTPDIELIGEEKELEKIRLAYTNRKDLCQYVKIGKI